VNGGHYHLNNIPPKTLIKKIQIESLGTVVQRLRTVMKTISQTFFKTFNLSNNPNIEDYQSVLDKAISQ